MKEYVTLRSMSLFAFVLSAALSAAGCDTVTKQVKASPAADSGFLAHPERMSEQRERFPFNRVWVSPEFRANRDKYRTIVIAPVNTEHLAEMDWWQRQNPKTQESLRGDTQAIAVFMRDAFRAAVSEDPAKRLQVVPEAGADTMILELALVEIVPSKAFLNAAAAVGGFFVPGMGMVASAGKGSVAIEGRLRDGVNGKVLAQMADREEAKSAVIDIAGFTWYDSAKDSIVDWSQQFVALANSDYSEKVSDSSPFTFVTW